MRNIRTERRCRKHVNRKGPEARLYMACVASVVLPTGMLIFAWTARPDVPWIVPMIGLTVSNNQPLIFTISLIDLSAFHGLCFHYISSRVRLLGRLVNASILLLVYSPTDEPQTSYGMYASSALAGQSLCRMPFTFLHPGQNLTGCISQEAS